MTLPASIHTPVPGFSWVRTAPQTHQFMGLDGVTHGTVHYLMKPKYYVVFTPAHYHGHVDKLREGQLIIESAVQAGVR